MGRILDVNQIVQQLLDGGHPSSTEVRGCQDHLNSRYQNKTVLATAASTAALLVLIVKSLVLPAVTTLKSGQVYFLWRPSVL